MFHYLLLFPNRLVHWTVKFLLNVRNKWLEEMEARFGLQ